MEKTGQFHAGSAKIKEAAQNRSAVNVRDMLLAQGANLDNEHGCIVFFAAFFAPRFLFALDFFMIF